MSILNSYEIDNLSQVRETGDIILLLVDHLPWEEPNHLKMLENKINLYLQFVKSGDIYKHYPNEKERIETKQIKIIFQVVLKYPPNDEADAFLKRTFKILQSVDIQLECRIKN